MGERLIEWLEFAGFILGFYLFFLFLLYAKVKASPRPVRRWLRILPTWIFLAMSGFILSMAVILPVIGHFQHRAANAEAFGRMADGAYFGSAAVWGLCCIVLVRRLYRAGGPLDDNGIQHGTALLQRMARSAFGPGDAARPPDETSDVQTLDLDGRQ